MILQNNSSFKIILFLLLCCFAITKAKVAGDQDSEKYDSHPEVLVLFVCVGLMIGAGVTHILSRISIHLPYTVVIFVIGMIVAFIVHNFEFASLGVSTRLWSEINPEVMLYIFLPVLLFGEAMNLSWHRVKGAFLQSSVLAGPGVLIGAYATGLFMKYCTDLNWSWNLCMIFGSIFSATDPVAVVSLLKTAGTSQNLSMLITGESLMNDGTAYVLFSLYFNIMEGEKYTMMEIIKFFIKNAICSPLLGLCIGGIFVYWVAKANKPLSDDENTIQIIATIVCAYFSFFVAQYAGQMSGVLSCVGAGIAFAWKAPAFIQQPESMHHVWHIIEFIANTLIFLLAGLIIGEENYDIITNAKYWGYVFIIYTFLMLLRMVLILGLYPVFSRFGLEVILPEALFIVWGGLRGALGISLALIVLREYHEIGIDVSDAQLLFFLVGGVTLLTLVINATTARWVIKKLGIAKDENCPERLAAIIQARLQLRKKVSEMAKMLTSDKLYVKRDDVLCHISLFGYDSLKDTHQSDGNCSNVNDDNIGKNALEKSPQIRRRRNTMEEMRLSVDYHNQNSLDKKTLRNIVSLISSDHVLAYNRIMFLECVRQKYWEFITQGRIPRSANVTSALLYSIDYAMDRAYSSITPISDWEFIENKLSINPYVAKVIDIYGSKIPSFFLFHHIKNNILIRKLHLRVYVLINYIDAHEEAQKEYLSFLTGVDSSESSQKFTEEQKLVLVESSNNVMQASLLLHAIDAEVVRRIVTLLASKVALSFQAKKIEDLVRTGLLQSQDAEVLIEDITHDVNVIRSEKAKEMKNEVARLMNHTMSPPPTIIKNDNKRTISSSSEGSTRGELKTPLL